MGYRTITAAAIKISADADRLRDTKDFVRKNRPYGQPTQDLWDNKNGVARVIDGILYDLRASLDSMREKTAKLSDKIAAADFLCRLQDAIIDGIDMQNAKTEQLFQTHADTIQDALGLLHAHIKNYTAETREQSIKSLDTIAYKIAHTEFKNVLHDLCKNSDIDSLIEDLLSGNEMNSCIAEKLALQNATQITENLQAYIKQNMTVLGNLLDDTSVTTYYILTHIDNMASEMDMVMKKLHALQRQ